MCMYCNTHYHTYQSISRLFGPYLHLKARIESKNPSIDDFNLRWVEHKIEELNNGVILEKEDITKANQIWKEWK